MKFKLDEVVKNCEANATGYNHNSLPSMADNCRKAYYKRPKLTLKERWYLFWSDPCYPLKYI